MYAHVIGWVLDMGGGGHSVYIVYISKAYIEILKIDKVKTFSLFILYGYLLGVDCCNHFVIVVDHALYVGLGTLH